MLGAGKKWKMLDILKFIRQIDQRVLGTMSNLFLLFKEFNIDDSGKEVY